MKSKYHRVPLLLFLITVISLACLIPTKKSDTGSDSPKSSATKASGDTGAVDKIVYEEGGFEFIPIQGWDVICAMDMIQMKAPDAHEEYGPMFLFMVGDNDTEMTTEEAFKKFQDESTAAKIEQAQKVKVGGFSALQAELTSQQGGDEIKAIALTSMLTARRQFTMMASAPAERWSTDITPYFEKVRNSIKFISIKPGAGCPAGTIELGFDSELDMDWDLESDEPESNFVMEDGLLRQWASEARASSQYSDSSWAAFQATGAPNVDECSDSGKAWASAASNSKEWIELTYEVPVYPTEITIYMSYNPSQVTEVQIIDVQGKAYTVVETEPVDVPYCPDAYEITLELTKKILVNKVKIFIDQSVLGLGWNEIDAVELVGYPEEGAVLPPPSKPSGGGTSSGSVNSPYQPGELASGTFAYDVTGYENDAIKGSNVIYQSTESTYVIGLISDGGRYSVTLFLPKDGLKEGVIDVIPYEQAGYTKQNSAAIAINAFLYIADGGQIDIQSDPATGKLTLVFSFQAHSKDFDDRSVEVSGAIKDIPLK